jgi:hypothetical protein
MEANVAKFDYKLYMKLNNSKALNHFEGHTKLNLNRLASSNEHHLMTNPTIVNGTLEASRILWLSLSLSRQFMWMAYLFLLHSLVPENVSFSTTNDLINNTHTRARTCACLFKFICVSQ